MLPIWLRRTIYTCTVIAWLVVAVNATPVGVHITEDVQLLATLVAVVGSIKWLVRRMLAPAHELFTAGKMVGRLEAVAETDPDVVRLDDHRPERRALRAVSDS